MTKRAAWLILLCAAAFGLRMTHLRANGLGVSPQINHIEYTVAAERMLKQGGWRSPFIRPVSAPAEPSAIMPPVYVALTAAAYAALGVKSVAATALLQIINALATTLLILPVFDAVRRLCGERAGWIAAALIAVNPALISLSIYVWDTALFALGVGATLWLTVWFSERPRGWRPAALFGAWLGALAYLNPALVLAQPFVVRFAAHRARDTDTRFTLRFLGATRFIVTTTIAWALVVTPWILRNALVCDQWVYMRGGLWLEVWLGACPQAHDTQVAAYRAQFPLDNGAAQRLLRELGERDYFRECRRRAVEAIGADPGAWGRLCLRRAPDFLLGTLASWEPVGASILPRRPWNRIIVAFLALQWLALGLATVVRLMVGPRRGLRHVVWLLAAFVACGALYVCTHADVRFRAPLEPFVASAVAVALAAGPSKTTPRASEDARGAAAS